jgi:hypothetical protein
VIQSEGFTYYLGWHLRNVFSLFTLYISRMTLCNDAIGILGDGMTFDGNGIQHHLMYLSSLS